MNIKPLPSEEQLTPEDWRIIAIASVNQSLEEDRNQAYTSLIEGIEGMRKVFDGCDLADHDRTYLAALTDIIEKVVKPLYGKE